MTQVTVILLLTLNVNVIIHVLLTVNSHFFITLKVESVKDITCTLCLLINFQIMPEIRRLQQTERLIPLPPILIKHVKKNLKIISLSLNSNFHKSEVSKF